MKITKKQTQDLLIKYPDEKGFSERNLWNMQNFYETYRKHEKLQTVSAEISGSNNVLILNKAKTIEEKGFYLKMCIKEHWPYRGLQRQIGNA